MQAELARKLALRRIMEVLNLEPDIFLVAHSELRAVLDPVIPSSLPTTNDPLLRLEIEAALRQALRHVQSVPPDPPSAGVAARDDGRGFTRLTPYGIVQPPPFSMVSDARASTRDDAGGTKRGGAKGGGSAKTKSAKTSKAPSRTKDFRVNDSWLSAHAQSIKTSIMTRVLGRTLLPREEALVFLWRALTRYDYMGLLSTKSAATQETIYKRFANHGAEEAFASLFNAALPRYHGLFPDLEAQFGCVGNFFAMRTETAPRLLLCNPPYVTHTMNAFNVKALQLLESSEITIVAILPAFETSDRNMLNISGACRDKYPTDYTTDVDTALLKQSRFRRWCGLYCKERFEFLNTVTDKTMGMTSVLVVILSSTDVPQVSVETIVQALPPGAIECTMGTRAANTYVVAKRAIVHKQP